MTAVAAPAARARPERVRARRAPARPRDMRVAAPARSTTRARSGWVSTVLVGSVLFALVSAVVFHVVLAQNQLELDHLHAEIAAEQHAYEQNRLLTADLSSPARIVAEAERLGLVLPATPPQYLFVPDAPLPNPSDDTTSTTTLQDWAKAKPGLGDQQP